MMHLKDKMLHYWSDESTTLIDSGYNYIISLSSGIEGLQILIGLVQFKLFSGV